MSFQLRLRVGLDHIFLKDWFKVYDRKQMLVVKFEDYATDPFTTLKTVFKHLDVGKKITALQDNPFNYEVDG